MCLNNLNPSTLPCFRQLQRKIHKFYEFKQKLKWDTLLRDRH